PKRSAEICAAINEKVSLLARPMRTQHAHHLPLTEPPVAAPQFLPMFCKTCCPALAISVQSDARERAARGPSGSPPLNHSLQGVDWQKLILSPVALLVFLSGAAGTWIIAPGLS